MAHAAELPRRAATRAGTAQRRAAVAERRTAPTVVSESCRSRAKGPTFSAVEWTAPS